MTTEFLRDHAFTTAWFGLMTFVWLGWAQEDPGPVRRWVLGAGSALGVALAGVFGLLVARHWDTPSALDGRYAWMGVVVAAEVLAAGVGCWLLSRRGEGRWMAWWVAVVVAAHFVPLALLLQHGAIATVGVVQLIGLVAGLPRLRAVDWPTSRVVGPWMGATLLLTAGISAVTYALR